MDALIQAGQLFFSLSILIILHEMGHFVPAKLFGIKVEKFYLFFDPWFSIFKKKIGDTEYGIGWLPLGGYVKIAGMVDESMDKEQLNKEPEPWEFRAKPAWQRLIVMLGGVTVNAILAVIIYTLVMFAYGRTYIKNDSLKDGLVVANSDLEEKLGLHTGDKIVSLNGTDVRTQNLERVLQVLFFSENLEVERNGEIVGFSLPDTSLKVLLEYKDQLETPILYFGTTFIVDSIVPDSPSDKAGMKSKDLIVGINDEQIDYMHELQASLSANKSQQINLNILRGNDTLNLPAMVSEEGKLGFTYRFNQDHPKAYQIVEEDYSFIQSITEGYGEAKFQLWFYYQNFKQIFNVKTGAYKGMGGFKAFGQMYTQSWDWEKTWRNTAFISIILAFMNLLPIPALDGGHVMFLLYELITGRKPHQKVLEYAQMAGMILLLSLVLFANINDWI